MSSEGSSTGPIKRVRTRTGCKECRERRTKCSESERDASGRRMRCVKCARWGRDCHYMAANGQGWQLAATARGSPPVRGITREELPQASDAPSCAQILGIVRQDLAATSEGSARRRLSRSPSSICATFPRHSPSPSTEISLFDASIRSESDSLLVSFLFSRNFDRIGVFGRSDPSIDNFQTSMLPYLAFHLATSSRNVDDEDDYVYHSALLLSAAYRAATCREGSPDEVAKHLGWSQRALTRIRQRPRCRTEKSIIAYGLTNLAAAWMAGPHRPELMDTDNLHVSLSSPLGHQVYDVQCVYITNAAIVAGVEASAAVPLAGDDDIETTFGVTRRMWTIFGRLASLLAQARALTGIFETFFPVNPLQNACERLLGDSLAAVTNAVASGKNGRIRQGTRLYHHMLSVLVLSEALHVPSDDALVMNHCSAILRLITEIPEDQRAVGCDFPVTIAACHCSDPVVRDKLNEHLRRMLMQALPNMPATFTIPERCLALDFTRGTGGARPWREALQEIDVPLLL